MGHITPRRILLLVALLAVAGMGAAGVDALSGNGSREFSQSTAGVDGAAEVGDYFGAQLAIGDFDGDGFGDVVAAAPHEDLGRKADAGQIQVFPGGRNGIRTAGDATIHLGTRQVVGASRAGDRFGSALAVGDFDGDGFDDLGVGVPGKAIGEADNAGVVVVLYGDARGLSGRGSARFGQDTVAEAVPGAGDRFGQSLTAGDFNGDGIDDLAVGAPGDAEPGADWAGSVTVIYGGQAGLTTQDATFLHQGIEELEQTPDAGDSLGWALAATDADGDGFDDLAVSAPGESVGEAAEAGLVHVFSGSADGVVVEGATSLTEDTPGVPGVSEAHDRFGGSLAGGDFDGAGVGDLAIGVAAQSAGAATASGVVLVVPGVDGSGLTGAGTKRLNQAKGVIGSPQAGDDFGHSVAVGDFNGNGRDDLAVSAPGETIDDNIGAGATHVFFGAAGGITKKRDEQWQAGRSGMAGRPEPNAGLGRALAAGDIDGDGRDDLVVAAPGRTASGRGLAGSFVVLYG